jgi:hypothetical protein
VESLGLECGMFVTRDDLVNLMDVGVEAQGRRPRRSGSSGDIGCVAIGVLAHVSGEFAIWNGEESCHFMIRIVFPLSFGKVRFICELYYRCLPNQYYACVYVFATNSFLNDHTPYSIPLPRLLSPPLYSL